MEYFPESVCIEGGIRALERTEERIEDRSAESIGVCGISCPILQSASQDFDRQMMGLRCAPNTSHK